MATVKEIPTNIRCLEYRQEKGDEFYGSCLYARFYFNLDRYELTIVSDCGEYGHKWPETPDSESFLELMARIGKDYLLGKLCGRPDIFDYNLTKELLYKWNRDDESKEKLDEIFEQIEYDYEPETGRDFVRLFDEYNDGYFSDTFEYPEYRYSYDAIKICEVFKEHIQPKIRELLKEESKPQKLISARDVGGANSNESITTVAIMNEHDVQTTAY